MLQIQSCAVSTNQSGVAVRVPLSGGGDGQRWAAPLRWVGGSRLRRRHPWVDRQMIGPSPGAGDRSRSSPTHKSDAAQGSLGPTSDSSSHRVTKRAQCAVLNKGLGVRRREAPADANPRRGASSRHGFAWVPGARARKRQLGGPTFSSGLALGLPIFPYPMSTLHSPWGQGRAPGERRNPKLDVCGCRRRIGILRPSARRQQAFATLWPSRTLQSVVTGPAGP